MGNFQKYGLDGPTKFEDLGEKYLRLYGFLNATYIQQAAVLSLYKFLNVPNPKEAKKRIEVLKIREVRHKLGAHSSDYLNIAKGTIESHVPVQLSLSGFNCDYFSNQSRKRECVDLLECLQKHLEIMIDLIDRIYEKAVKTVFRGNKVRLAEFKSKLDELRIGKSGGLVINTAKGGKIVIHALAPKNHARPPHKVIT